ncbi:MAG: MFS transporter [Betaproteobacteria bacterium]|nr:MAG: MFS transporter [Betaproteobacteria bacterium]
MSPRGSLIKSRRTFPLDSAAAGTFRNDARVIGLIGSAHCLSHFFQLVLPPLFPLLKAEFDVSYATLGALVSVFYVSSGVCQFGAGFAVDRFGARPVLLGGIGLLTGGALVAGLVPGIYWLFPLAAVMGLGNGVFHPADFAVLNANVNPRRLGHAYSTHGIGGSLGYAVAPVVSYGLASVIGWRQALIVLGALGLIALAALATQRHLLASRAHGVEAPRHTLAGSMDLFRQSPILLCFAYFAVLTLATIGIQTFAATALNAAYAVPLALATSALTAYLLGSTAGILAGGFLAAHTGRHDRVAAGPSRDMIVRGATPRGASGRVYGFVYSGLDLGATIAPVAVGAVLDHHEPRALFIAVAVCLFLAIGTVLQVGRSVKAAAASPHAAD